MTLEQGPNSPIDVRANKKRRGRPKLLEGEKKDRATISIKHDVMMGMRRKALQDGLSSLSSYVEMMGQKDMDEEAARSVYVAATRVSEDHQAQMVRLGEKLAQVMMTRDITVKDQRRIVLNYAALSKIPVTTVIEDAMVQARIWLTRWKA